MRYKNVRAVDELVLTSAYVSIEWKTKHITVQAFNLYSDSEKPTIAFERRPVEVSFEDNACR